MNPLGIALQGIGLAATFVALQGFGVSEDVAPVPAPQYGSADDSESDSPIHRQNHALLQLIAAFVASGALE